MWSCTGWSHVLGCKFLWQTMLFQMSVSLSHQNTWQTVGSVPTSQYSKNTLQKPPNQVIFHCLIKVSLLLFSFCLFFSIQWNIFLSYVLLCHRNMLINHSFWETLVRKMALMAFQQVNKYLGQTGGMIFFLRSKSSDTSHAKIHFPDRNPRYATLSLSRSLELNPSIYITFLSGIWHASIWLEERVVWLSTACLSSFALKPWIQSGYNDSPNREPCLGMKIRQCV